MEEKEKILVSRPDTAGVRAAQPQDAPFPSVWMPPRGALVAVALPQRFVEGVAWDEV